MRLVTTALVLTLAAAGLAPRALALEPGDAAPQFAAQPIEGAEPVSLARYQGKVVWLDFWASWCTPCVTAMPMLEGLRKQLPADRFQIVAVNLDRDLDKARAFLREHPVGYPSASDPQGRIPGTFGVETMPTSFLIDRSGVIRHVHRGFRSGDMDQIRARIRALLEDHDG
jgi:peroxiredoxin